METDNRRGRQAAPSTTPQEDLGERERPMSVSYGIVGAILLLGTVGFALDRALDTTPWFLLGGLFLGLVVGFYSLRKFIVNG